MGGMPLTMGIGPLAGSTAYASPSTSLRRLRTRSTRTRPASGWSAP